MVQGTAHTDDSWPELLEALAAGQRLIVSEQRQTHKQIDRLGAAVQATNRSFDSIEACLERVEQRLERVEQRLERVEQPEHDDQSNVFEQRLRQ